jgi:hypothetical protein
MLHQVKIPHMNIAKVDTIYSVIKKSLKARTIRDWFKGCTSLNR